MGRRKEEKTPSIKPPETCIQWRGGRDREVGKKVCTSEKVKQRLLKQTSVNLLIPFFSLPPSLTLPNEANKGCERMCLTAKSTVLSTQRPLRIGFSSKILIFAGKTTPQLLKRMMEEEKWKRKSKQGITLPSAVYMLPCYFFSFPFPFSRSLHFALSFPGKTTGQSCPKFFIEIVRLACSNRFSDEL